MRFLHHDSYITVVKFEVLMKCVKCYRLSVIEWLTFTPGIIVSIKNSNESAQIAHMQILSISIGMTR